MDGGWFVGDWSEEEREKKERGESDGGRIFISRNGKGGDKREESGSMEGAESGDKSQPESDEMRWTIQEGVIGGRRKGKSW